MIRFVLLFCLTILLNNAECQMNESDVIEIQITVINNMIKDVKWMHPVSYCIVSDSNSFFNKIILTLKKNRISRRILYRNYSDSNKLTNDECNGINISVTGMKLNNANDTVLINTSYYCTRICSAGFTMSLAKTKNHKWEIIQKKANYYRDYTPDNYRYHAE